MKSMGKLCAGFLRPALILTAAVVAAAVPTAALEGRPGEANAVHASSASAAGWEKSRLGSIDQRVLSLALNAAGCAVQSGKVTSPGTLTVIDYTKPSTQKRLWVLDLRTHTLLFEELVAHGQGSGNNIPTLFSNENETHRSSIGLFETRDTYVGKNGYSLRLKGLDEGFNHRAGERAIVMHGAPYVSDDFVKKNGRLGRSWGCPALSEGVAREVIDRVRGNGIVFSYYPNQDWLDSSRYLGDCGAAS